jgi:hypothetical protein
LRITPDKAAAAALFWVDVKPLYRELPAWDWRVIGPFPSRLRRGKPGIGFDTVFGPEKVRDFTATYKGDHGQQLTWVHPKSDGPHVNLHKITGAYQYRVSYAVTTINSPEDRKARIKFGVDYWAKMWLNGKKVFQIGKSHGAPGPGQFTIPVDLKQGANELLVKVNAGSAGNGFWLAISDPGDLKIGPGQDKNREYPQCILRNKAIKMTIYLPDAHKGYYRGPRFDWSGMIKRVEYQGHTLFGAFVTPHNPEANDNAIGPAEEFGMGTYKYPGALGYEEARAGGNFIKIGVGILKKDGAGRYKFYKLYKIVKPGKWKIKRDKDTITFSQEMKNGQWGYEYRKIIKLSESPPGFTISHFLKNTGSQTIETTDYAHNFFIIDEDPIGTDYQLRFPFAPQAERPLKGILEIKGKEIIFVKDMKEKPLFVPLAGFEDRVADNEVIIENKKAKIGVRIKGDRPVVQFNLYCAKTTVSPEPFIKLFLKSGEQTQWTTKYYLFDIR